MAEINREQLVRAISLVLPAVAKKETFVQSNMIGIRSGCLVAYDDELSICYDFPDLDVGDVALDGTRLHELLSTLTTELVAIEATDSEIKIRAGRVRASIKTAALELPLSEIEAAADEFPLSDTFRERLETIAAVCSSDMARPLLTCVSVTEDWIEGSDGYRLVKMRCSGMPSFLLPARVAMKVADYPITKVLVGQRNEWVHFSTDDNVVISCRAMSGEYPDLSVSYDLYGPVFTLPEGLSDVVSRASLFSGRAKKIDDEISVHLTANRVVVTSHDDSGRFEEVARWKHDDVDASFSIHPSFFRLALRQGTRCQLDRSRIKFSGPDWEHVVALR